MEKKFEMLPPMMPNFISYKVPARPKQEGFNPDDVNRIPITDLSQEEAEAYGELMKQSFIEHWKVAKLLTGYSLAASIQGQLSDEKWKEKFEHWLTNNQWVNKKTATHIIDYVEQIYSTLEKENYHLSAENTWLTGKYAIAEYNEQIEKLKKENAILTNTIDVITKNRKDVP